MSRHGRERRLFARLCSLAFCAAIVVAAGCDLIVPGGAPSFKCGGTDPADCPNGQICAIASGTCVDMTSACSVSGCPNGGTCNSSTQTCALGEVDASEDSSSFDSSPRDTGLLDTGSDGNTGPSPIGAVCTQNANCQSNLCADGTLLTSAVSNNQAICSQPCCKSEECGTGNVCFGAGTGGSYCVPATRVSDLSAGLGAAAGGATCVNNQDCRSGRCSTTNHVCMDNCCASTDCANSNCTRENVGTAAHNIFVCDTGPGSHVTADTCSGGNTSCESDTCIDDGVETYCAPTCCGQANCAAAGGLTVCSYFQVSPSVEFVRLCLDPADFSSPNNKNVGTACTASSQCKSNLCNTVCLDPCCEDANCTAAGKKCLPVAGNPRLLGCQ